jgi:hypothetical protein
VLGPELVGRGIDCSATARSVAAGRLVFAAGRAADCVTAIAKQPCNELFNPVVHGPPPACVAALAPQVAPGGSCWPGIVDECSGGRCVEGRACPGTCQAVSPTGGACSGQDDCALDDACVRGVCGLAGTEGQACNDASAICGGSLVCRSAVVGGAKTCQPPIPEGGFCNDSSAGPFGPCVLPTQCVDGHCRRPGKPGDKCDPGLPSCGLLGWCDSSTDRCAVPPKVGERCGVGDFLCDGGYCDSDTGGTCRPLVGNGDPCYSDAACETGYCDPDQHRCTPRCQG